MGHKYQVTNISDGPKFIAEAGRLLQPGANTTAGRLDETTRLDPGLLVKVGDFDRVAVARVAMEKQRYDEDDEDEAPSAKVALEAGPATLSVVKHQSRIVPLEAPYASTADSPKLSKAPSLDADEDEDDAPLIKDELDDEVPTADRGPRGKTGNEDDDGSAGGFVTRKALPTKPLVGR